MATRELEVRNGPDKADLLRAVANPDKHLHVSFETSGDLVEAHIDTIEELRSDGMLFGLRGQLATGNSPGCRVYRDLRLRRARRPFAAQTDLRRGPRACHRPSKAP
jgi:hypothetical protein